MTGCASVSAHSTTNRFDTMAALALVVELHHAALREALERHLHHADRAEHDLLARADHGLGLLTAQHRARDFRRVGEVREARVLDAQARLLEALLQLALEPGDDFVAAAAQRELGLVVVVRVVGVFIGEMAQRRLGLDGHVLLVVVDVEHRARRVAHLPDHRRRDLDRIAALVVHLELFAVEVAQAQADTFFLLRKGFAQRRPVE